MMDGEFNADTTRLRAWQQRMQLTERAAAVALGISYSTYGLLRGNVGGKTKPLDERTAYACAALEAGLTPQCPDWADRRTLLAMAALSAGIKPI